VTEPCLRGQLVAPNLVAHSLKTVKRFVLCSAIIAATSASAFAAAIIKGNNTTGTDLTLGSAWNGGNAPGTGDVATWSSTSDVAAQTVNSDVTWNSINLTSGLAGALNISGTGAINLSIAQSGNANAINNASGRDLTIANSINLTATPGTTFTPPPSNVAATNRLQFVATNNIILTGNVTASGGAANSIYLNLRGTSTASRIDGTVTVNGQLVKADAGTWTLNGNNSVGWIYMSNGILLGGNDNAFGGSSATIYLDSASNGFTGMTIASKDSTPHNFGNSIDFTSGTGFTGTLNLGQASIGTGAVTFSGVNLGGAVRKIQTNASTSISGSISGTTSGGITKSGTGSLTLSGDSSSTYAGVTTVSAGTLITGNASALGTGNVSIGAGTLQVGNGLTNILIGVGSLTLNNSGSVLDLAAQAGIISFASNQNFVMSLGTWKLNSDSLTTGSNVDQLSLSGAGTYNISGGTIDLAGFTSNVAGTYNIIGGTGTASGLSFINGTAGFSYGFDTTGDLIVTAVPEPSACGLIGVGLAGVLSVMRRRRA